MQTFHYLDPVLAGFTVVASAPELRPFDVEAVRRDFPILRQRVHGHQLVWLDNAATTHKPAAVMRGRCVSTRKRTPTCIGRPIRWRKEPRRHEGARETVRAFLGAASAREIVFVRGTTEAANLVAQSWGRHNIGPGDEIVVTELEHH